MKTKLTSKAIQSAAPLLLCLMLQLQPSTLLAQGTTFTYQGILTEGGAPANGVYDLEFSLFATSTGGFPATTPITNNDLVISNGLFTVILDFPAAAAIFDGGDRWLGIGVRPGVSVGAFTNVVPRQKITSTPYAIRALSLSGALPSSGLTGTYGSPVTISNPADVFAGAFTGNGGGLTNVNATGLGGYGAENFWLVGGNYGPAVPPFLGSVVPAPPLEIWSSGVRALVLDGNPTSPNLIGGFANNSVASGKVGATIGGGGKLGLQNIVTEDFGTVGGGFENVAGNLGSVIGGHKNTATGLRATSAGGSYNTASGEGSTVGGGDFNTAQDNAGVVAGGTNNTAIGLAATIGGGANNLASGIAATIGGGGDNGATNDAATVAGGGSNIAGGIGATISGGTGNRANGIYATVPGGQDNVAQGDRSFAGGLQARALHGGAFVWADSASLAGNFDSTGENQFLIRAAGGVGIGTTSPVKTLDVRDGIGSQNGSIHVGGTGANGNPKLINFGDGDFVHIGENGADDRMELKSSSFFFTSGNVGMGRVSAVNRLEVEGEASKTTAGSWLANSDARIKTDVQTVSGALDKLAQVRLVKFHYTDNYRAAHPGIVNREYLNVVAQEFAEVFPDHVKSSGEKLTGSDDPILQVDTYPLTIYSAAAVQELNQRLTKELNRRDAENAELKGELVELKKLVQQLVQTSKEQQP